jgi:hypothetical protein
MFLGLNFTYKFKFHQTASSHLIYVRFSISMEMKIQVVVLWIVTLCSDVVGYKHFGEPCYLHLHFTLKMEMEWPSETLVSYITTWHHNPDDHDLNT